MNTELSTQATLRDFLPLYKLGTGSFSSVYKVKRITDNQIYALKKVKILTMSEKQKLNALNQIRILASIDCHNIISYKEAFFDEQLGVLCIVMQFANEGDLTKKIHHHKRMMTQIPQQQIWKIAHHLLLGLNHLHERSILHRDVKSANVFISSGCYKLGDLNVSKVQSNQCKFASTQTGTPNYACPEIWKDQPYDTKSDIWSLGCVIYELCTFKPPFKGKNMNQIYNNVIKGSYEPIPAQYSVQLHSFISKCLKKKPLQRPSCLQLLKINESLWQKCPHNQKYQDQDCQSLMNTIYMPQQAHKLNDSLPKSNYDGQIKSKKKLSFEPNKVTSQISYKKNLSLNQNIIQYSNESIGKEQKSESPKIKEVLSYNCEPSSNKQNFQSVKKNLAIQGLKDLQFKPTCINNLSERVIKEAVALLASIQHENRYLTQRGAKQVKHKSLNYLEEAKKKLKARQQSLNRNKGTRKSAQPKTQKSVISISKQKNYQQHKRKKQKTITQKKSSQQFKYTQSIHVKILQKIDNQLAKLKKAKSNQYLDHINSYIIPGKKSEIISNKQSQNQSQLQQQGL